MPGSFFFCQAVFSSFIIADVFEDVFDIINFRDEFVCFWI